MKTKKKFIVAAAVLVVAFVIGVIYCCGNNPQPEMREADADLQEDSLEEYFWQDEPDTVYNNTLPGLPYFLNTVAGHNEQDTIVGNFTGRGIDTLYIVAMEKEEPEWECDAIDYWAVCSNPSVPRVKLYGHTLFQPKLVYEGDLDRNGRDEWGYLHTWMNSQFRTYRVFTLVGKEWRYLTDDWEFLCTPEFFRASGKDILEPGPRKGTVKINYATAWPDIETRDTVIKPNFTVIDDEE